MNNNPIPEKKVDGIFTTKFYYTFRALFRPVTRTLMKLGITPNIITIFSLFMGTAAGISLALDHLWLGLMFGYFMSFSDIVDGQLAKEYSMTSKFGGILDSVIDRYNEFFLFAGLGIRYVISCQLWWAFACAVIFLNSMMISYIKARAEADGFNCSVGKLQRPERLTILAIGVAFNGLLLEPAIVILAVFTFTTVLQRVRHLYKQCV